MHDHHEPELAAEFETRIWPLLRAGPYFKRAAKAIAFVEYLLKQAKKGESASLGEIARVVFDGGTLPPDKGLNALRTLAYRIRALLQAFFEKDPVGMRAGYIPEVRCVDGRYGLRFLARHQAGVPDGVCDAFDRFWNLSPDPLIQTSTRVFAALGDSLFLRDIRSEDGGDVNALMRELGVTPPDTVQMNRWRRTRHYCSAGETVGMLYILDAFVSRDRRIRLGNLPRYGGGRGDANLIQIGLPRTSDTALHELIQGERFYLAPRGVYDREASEVEEDRREPLYPETEFRSDDAGLDKSDAWADRYVIVTRRPNWDPNCSILAITSNHGRATEAVCNFLCEDSRLEALVGRLGLGRDETALRRFQVVFRVRLVRYGEREIDREVEIKDPPPASALLHGAGASDESRPAGIA
jgi:hypothetical protein